MSGTWPQLDVQDFTLRSRHYLNELIAKFYQDAELWRYLSQSAREIAQRGSAVRRILDAVTATSTRTVAHNAYRCHHVEYLPSTGRTEMLEKIDPLQVGHKTYDGSTPQYWYEDVGNIGLDPLPDGAYNLRLYVSDYPRIVHTTFPITSFVSGWTSAVTGSAIWTLAGYARLTDVTLPGSGTLTWNTALTAAANYIFSFRVDSLSGMSLVLSAGGVSGRAVTSAGIYTFSLTPTTTDLVFTATATANNATVVFDDLYIYKEADFSSLTDLSDLPPIWNHTLVLMTLSLALQRDNRTVMSKVLSILTAGEIDYLRSNLIEVIPDSKATRWGER